MLNHQTTAQSQAGSPPRMNIQCQLEYCSTRPERGPDSSAPNGMLRFHKPIALPRSDLRNHCESSRRRAVQSGPSARPSRKRRATS